MIEKQSGQRKKLLQLKHCNSPKYDGVTLGKDGKRLETTRPDCRWRCLALLLLLQFCEW